MHTTQEKQLFSERLRYALKITAPAISKAAELANHFNLRHPKNPITNQAAHKWLTGQTLPTPEKIKTLALWLNVSEQWLRVGTEISETAQATDYEKLILKKLQSLTVTQQKLIYDLIAQFLNPPAT